jgi:hypothetical protein
MTLNASVTLPAEALAKAEALPTAEALQIVNCAFLSRSPSARGPPGSANA